MSWEERMADKAAARRAIERAQLLRDTDKVAAKYGYVLNRDPNPPDDGTCRDCYQWRQYPPGQEHFGFTWWNVCSQRGSCWNVRSQRGSCIHQHDHHDGDVYLAHSHGEVLV